MTDENSSGATPESTPAATPEFPGAAAAIAAFGGIRPMAARLDVPVSTVQGWKQRDAIPENRVAQIRAAAAADGIDLSATAGTDGDDRDAGDARPVASPPQSAPAAGAAPDSPAEDRPQSVQTAASAAPASPASSSGGASVLAVLALLVALAAGGGAGWLWWTQHQSRGDDLAGRIDALESTLSERAAGTDAVAGQLAALAGRLDTLAGKLDTLAETASDNDLAGIRSALDDAQAAITANRAAQAAMQTGIDATLDDISGRLVAVEKRQGDAAAVEARAVGLAIAASEIRRTMRSGAPFAGELATLRALAGADAALTQPLATLEAEAPNGLPTATDMARRFDALIGNIITADRVQNDTTWYQRVLDRVSGLVSVRRIGGDSTGDSVDAVIARTEAELADGDLAGAVAEAATLQGLAGETVAPWLADARDLLAAEDAVAAINTRALAALANLRGN